MDLARLKSDDDAEAQVAIALLILLLRDLAQGRIPIGYGTNRGMGAIALQSVAFEGRSLSQELAALDNAPIFDSNMALQESPLLQQLNQQWQQWLNNRRTAA
ncbi:MAG: hypothetical protein DCF15_06850 [Phormidesmis priestleyi]|uniref:Uncharacterized protein n=1 Tax=Phormidesmis priestleyi TaxID=268141 RepID=A0A2W4XT36_9CYAN|nr:MAG: hypothetical protein DCF15_06850 [Phormidesmis priestleyi]